jgi:hypothetical protein
MVTGMMERLYGLMQNEFYKSGKWNWEIDQVENGIGKFLFVEDSSTF